MDCQQSELDSAIKTGRIVLNISATDAVSIMDIINTLDQMADRLRVMFGLPRRESNVQTPGDAEHPQEFPPA